jgi:zinc-binding alcohol dehydrogenase/oxidoreductase
MQAILLHEIGDPDVLRLEEYPDPVPGDGEVVVRLRAAAINRRDVWIRRGRYPGISFPIILGSDGAGEVVGVGPGVDRGLVGRPVVIDPSFEWGADPRAQSESFHILGLKHEGTYAEYVRVPADHVHGKPSHLSFEQAAAVPLASVTAYRALVGRAQVRSGETVLVTGIGGGVATSALLLARALGAEVFVTSGSDDKIEAARSHGALGGVNHTRADWTKAFLSEFERRPDVVLDGAGGETFDRALEILKPGGRLVSYGATLGPAKHVEVRRIFWKQLSVLGSTMGTRQDFAAMMALYSSARVQPIVDSVLPLRDAAAGHRRVEEGRQFGKMVLAIPGDASLSPPVLRAR